MNRPQIVAHADWSADARKRWVAIATRRGERYVAQEPRPVGIDLAGFLRGLRGSSSEGCVFLGCDFPLGLPVAFARRAGIDHFTDALPYFGAGEWEKFYELASTPTEISIHRPFYPRGVGGAKHAHLTSALGVPSMDDLRRRCELASDRRGAACALFWTLGGNQVGRAAISGWRDLLSPALRASKLDIALWPFAGCLEDLLNNRSYVVAETYPADACVQLGLPPPGRGWSKRRCEDRRRFASPLRERAENGSATLEASLIEALARGFGDQRDAEDQFDAVVGLLAMLQILAGTQPEGSPDDPVVRHIEGWILGQPAD